jgi:hypothetical protein
MAVIFASSFHSARAQDRWVDDEAVQPLLRVRAGAGVGVGVLAYHGTGYSSVALYGSGVNVEAALGLGRGFEVGVRVGLRTNDAGRGLRADEVARGFDTATFGTGLSTLANPELRLRWRAVRSRWLEAGVENRFVAPTGSDPIVTEIVGAWTSAHIAHLARADVGLDGVLSWQKFAAGYVLIPAFGIPFRLSFNVSRGLFAGVVVTTRAFAATRYTTSVVQITTGLIGGYRFGACDATIGAYLIDVVNDGRDRSGVGLGLSCRLGREAAAPGWSG